MLASSGDPRVGRLQARAPLSSGSRARRTLQTPSSERRRLSSSRKSSIVKRQRSQERKSNPPIRERRNSLAVLRISGVIRTLAFALDQLLRFSFSIYRVGLVIMHQYCCICLYDLQTCPVLTCWLNMKVSEYRVGAIINEELMQTASWQQRLTV